MLDGENGKRPAAVAAGAPSHPGHGGIEPAAPVSGDHVTTVVCSPVGKKRVWIDARNQQFIAYITYDRRGEIWKSFEAGWSQYSKGNVAMKDESGKPAWSWTYIHSHDIQSNRMTRIMHTENTTGGYKSQFSTQGVDVYNKYLTNQAIQRLGQS